MIPLKFETASKCAYFAMVLGAFASVIIAASWAHGQWGGVAMAMVLAAGVVGAGFLSSFGAEGLAAYWRRRHDAEMLKEVDRLQAEQAVADLLIPRSAARMDIVDWEDRRRG